MQTHATNMQQKHTIYIYEGVAEFCFNTRYCRNWALLQTLTDQYYTSNIKLCVKEV